MSESKYLRNSGDKNQILTSKFYYISSKWTQGIFAERSEWTKPECPIHSHEHFELQYLAEGEMINSIDYEEIHMKPGDFYLVGPEAYHSFKLITPKIVFFSIFIYHPSARADVCRILETAPCPVTGTIPPEDRNAFEVIIHQICDRKNFSLLENTETITLGTLMALHMAYRTNPIKLGDNFEEMGDLQKCLSYILAHYNEQLTLKSVAKTIGISSGYFCRLFSERVGITFLDYLNKLRIRKSRNMLIYETQKSITDIALDVGFRSYSNFYRIFVSIEGISPAEFRKRHGVFKIKNEKR